MNGLLEEARIALNAVWHRRWLALAIAWGVAMLGWLVVAFVPNSYESKARVYVQTDTLLADKVGITPGEQRRDLDRLEQTLTSTVNLRRVVRETALGDGLVSDGAISGEVEKLRDSIEVKADKDNLFEVTGTLSSAGRSDAATAALARDVVDKLIAIVQEEMIAGGQSETSDSIRILDEQIRQKGQELQAAEATRVKYETENLGLLPGIGSASQRLSSAQAELSQIESQLVSARSALAALNGQLAGTPQTLSTPVLGGGGGGGGGALAQAQGELASMRARGFTDAHPDVVTLKSQIAALRAQPSGNGRSAPGTYQSPNPAYSSLVSMRAERQAAVGALEQRKAALESDMATMRGRQVQEPGVAAKYEELQRGYDVIKASHDKLLADREQLRLRGEVTSETDAARFRLIDPPSAPRSPAAPNRPLLLLGVLVVAIGAGIAAAFALGQMTSSFATTARLERATGLPVIGSVSRMISGEERADARRKLRWFYGGAGGLAGMFLVLLAVELVVRGTVI